MDEREDICDQFSAYVDGELSAQEAARVEAAVEADPALAAALHELRATRELVRGLPRASAPEGFSRRVISRAERMHLLGAPATAGPYRSFRWITAAAAAVVLLAAGLGAFLLINAARAPDGETAPGKADQTRLARGPAAPGGSTSNGLVERSKESGAATGGGGEEAGRKKRRSDVAAGKAGRALTEGDRLGRRSAAGGVVAEVAAPKRLRSVIASAENVLINTDDFRGVRKEVEKLLREHEVRATMVSRPLSSSVQVQYVICDATPDQLKDVRKGLKAVRSRQHVSQDPVGLDAILALADAESRASGRRMTRAPSLPPRSEPSPKRPPAKRPSPAPAVPAVPAAPAKPGEPATPPAEVEPPRPASRPAGGEVLAKGQPARKQPPEEPGPAKDGSRTGEQMAAKVPVGPGPKEPQATSRPEQAPAAKGPETRCAIAQAPAPKPAVAPPDRAQVREPTEQQPVDKAAPAAGETDSRHRRGRAAKKAKRAGSAEEGSGPAPEQKGPNGHPQGAPTAATTPAKVGQDKGEKSDAEGPGRQEGKPPARQGDLDAVTGPPQGPSSRPATRAAGAQVAQGCLSEDESKLVDLKEKPQGAAALVITLNRVPTDPARLRAALEAFGEAKAYEARRQLESQRAGQKGPASQK